MTRHIVQRSQQRWLVAAMLIASMALVVACGSDDDSSSELRDGMSYTSGQAPSVDGKSNGAADEAATGAIAPDSGRPEGETSGAPGGASGASLAALLDRKIIRTATINIETDAVSRNFEDVSNIAAGAGGFVASSSFGDVGDDKQRASVTIRVPGERYEDTLRQLRQLGEVQSEQVSTNEVTAEFTDLESRLRNLQATEQQYIGFLARAVDLNDVLLVQDRLNMTRAEIEQVQGRIGLLANQTDLATITVHLDPPIVGASEPKSGAGNPLEVAQEAFEASLVVLIGIATVALAVAAFSWWLLPLAALGFWLGKRQMRRGAPPPAA